MPVYSQYLKKIILNNEFHQIIHCHCHCLCQKPRTNFEQRWKKSKIKRDSEGAERRHISEICLLHKFQQHREYPIN